jgi:hypothetical protein
MAAEVHDTRRGTLPYCQCGSSAPPVGSVAGKSTSPFPCEAKWAGPLGVHIHRWALPIAQPHASQHRVSAAITHRRDPVVPHAWAIWPQATCQGWESALNPKPMATSDVPGLGERHRGAPLPTVTALRWGAGATSRKKAWCAGLGGPKRGCRLRRQPPRRLAWRLVQHDARTLNPETVTHRAA